MSNLGKGAVEKRNRWPIPGKKTFVFATLGWALLVGLYISLPFGQESLELTLKISVASADSPGKNESSSGLDHSSTEPSAETTPRDQLQDGQSMPVVNARPKNYKDSVIDEEKCRIRNYDFNDPVILERYFTSEPTPCPEYAKPFLFYAVVNPTTGRSCVGLNHTVLKKLYGDSIDPETCTYREVIRNVKSKVIDSSFEFGPTKALTVGHCPAEEFIWIECTIPEEYDVMNILFRLSLPFLRYFLGLSLAYEQPLMLPAVKEVPAKIRANNIEEKPLHVLVLGLDSVSRLNAHRQFPQTLEFLQSKKNFVELFGYNKIGVDSNPNQIPLLTGVPHSYASDRIGLNPPVNLTRYIWDYYADRGFRTMYYAEKHDPKISVFPPSGGFQKIPTTYWPNPLIRAVEESPLKRREGIDLCVGADIPAKHYLDYTYNLMKLLGDDRPLFSYQFLTQAADDDLNGGRRLDGYLHDFFTKMENDGILKNTAVFFISDHGFRFGDFRKTAQGRYEDMLPFGFVLMPERYYERKPGALENVKTNSRRLVTAFDLHATLRELADPWDEGRVVRTMNGFSLLSNVISSDRNCEDAHINIQFCMCFEPQPHDNKSDSSLSLARYVIEELNSIIRKSEARTMCSEWSLESILAFVRLSEGDRVTDFYRIMIKAKPIGEFEAAAEFREADRSWKLLSDIDRIDSFGLKSRCVEGDSFERYCHCLADPPEQSFLKQFPANRWFSQLFDPTPP